MIDRYPLHVRLSYLTGLFPGILLRSITGIPYFVGTIVKYQRANQSRAFPIKIPHLFPILTDRTDSAGTARGHYFHQDLWAAQKIFAASPRRHIDVGSRVDGFIAHLLVFMPVTVIDIRDMKSEVKGLSFVRDDATKLSQFPDHSIESISSLHAAEHFGLGRYSDPVDPAACFKFMEALQRVLAPGGSLYFSVPVGRERVEFNAHRIFAPKTVVENFARLKLSSFSFVGDDGKLNLDREPSDAADLDYGCGLFHFVKPPVFRREAEG